jgi:tyrosine-protein kinase Etk/Wzc
MNIYQTSQNTITAQTEEIDFKAWFFRILRLWPWFLGFMFLSLLVAWFYLQITEPVYQSSASIMIKDDKKTGVGSTMDNNVLKALNISGSGKLLENEIEVLKSADLIREVVLKEKLYLTFTKKKYFADEVVYNDDQPFQLEIANPELISKPIYWEISSNNNGWTFNPKVGGAIPIDIDKWYEFDGLRFRFISDDSALIKQKFPNSSTEYVIRIVNPNQAVLEYKRKIDIKQVGKQSTVISLSVDDSHYGRGKAFLGSLIRIYNQQGLNDKNLTTSNTMDFLEERLGVVERDLRTVEGTIEVFKRNNHITEVSEQAKSYMDMVKTMDQKKAEQETQVNIVNALEKEIANPSVNVRLVPNTLGVADHSATLLIEQYNNLILQRERIASLAGPKNPALADLDNQVKEVRLTLLENVRNLRKANILTLNDIKEQDRKLNEKLLSIPALEKQLLEISRDRNVKQQIYLFLLQKREESAIALASSVIDSRSVETPRGLKKVKPISALIYGTAIAIGLFLALIPILLIDFLDDKVGSVREVVEKSMLPLLGELNYVKNLDSPIAITAKNRDVISEQIRAIRTNISFTGKGSQVKKIMVTSHVPGEGKSFTSLNIAASYALLGKKVAVMEFDLRRPRLMKNLGLISKKGISNYLSGQLTIDEIIIPVDTDLGQNLHIIPSGPIPPNPSELILGERMQNLMDELEKQYDFILIDTPPFSLVTDAILLKQHADISIVVLRQGFSSKEAYRDIFDKLRSSQDDSLYVILNGVNRHQKYSYYASKYSQYGYGYGYGTDKNGYFEG